MTSLAPLVFDWRRSGFSLTMLHEPSREHGRRSFLDPLIHERSHLLAKVRGVAKLREFVELKTVAPCRQQEFPRRLNVAAGGTAFLLSCGYKCMSGWQTLCWPGKRR